MKTILKTNSHNKLIGKMGEDKATEFLQQNNYQIIHRNFRSRLGEIDIVAHKENILYCVEVKTRLTSNFGAPIDAITPRKLQKMYLMAEICAQSLNFNGTIQLLVCEVTKDGCSLREI